MLSLIEKDNGYVITVLNTNTSLSHRCDFDGILPVRNAKTMKRNSRKKRKDAKKKLDRKQRARIQRVMKMN